MNRKGPDVKSVERQVASLARACKTYCKKRQTVVVQVSELSDELVSKGFTVDAVKSTVTELVKRRLATYLSTIDLSVFEDRNAEGKLIDQGLRAVSRMMGANGSDFVVCAELEVIVLSRDSQALNPPTTQEISLIRLREKLEVIEMEMKTLETKRDRFLTEAEDAVARKDFPQGRRLLNCKNQVVSVLALKQDNWRKLADIAGRTERSLACQQTVDTVKEGICVLQRFQNEGASEKTADDIMQKTKQVVTESDIYEDVICESLDEASLDIEEDELEEELEELARSKSRKRRGGRSGATSRKRTRKS